MGKDILERLTEFNIKDRVRIGNISTDAFDLLDAMRVEIERLRSLAGAVTPGPDLVDLRRLLQGTASTSIDARCGAIPLAQPGYSEKPQTEYPDWMSMK